MRRCVGCMESRPKDELFRIAYFDGKLTLDRDGRAKGRGAYVCNAGECFEKALKKNGFARTLKGNIHREELAEIRREIDESR